MMRRVLSTLILSCVLLCSTLPFCVSATALAPLPSGTDLTSFVDNSGLANIVFQLLKNGFDLDFGQFTGDITELKHILLNQELSTTAKDYEILEWQDVTGNQGEFFTSQFLSGHFDSETQIVPSYDIPREYLSRRLANTGENIPDPEPTYPVDSLTLEYARMIKNYSLYKSTYGLSCIEPFYNSVSVAFPINTRMLGGCKFPTMLFYNTSNNSFKFYYYFNDTWNSLNSASRYVFWDNHTRISIDWNYRIMSRTLPKISSTDYFTYDSEFNKIGVPNIPDGEPFSFPSYSSLNDLLSMLVGFSNNLDIYVGDSIANALPIVASTPLPSVIQFGNGFEIDVNDNSFPIDLVYPVHPYINLRPFIQAIIDAINNKNVLTYDDISGLIVDVNGQPVVATYGVVRNDYDTLIIEQYGFEYPHFRRNEYTDSVITAVNNTTHIVGDSYGVLPKDLQYILIGGGLVAIFGLLIKKMLG